MIFVKAFSKKYAYLLETGDELLFEEYQYNTENTGQVDGEQKMITRSIAKVEV